MTPWSISVQQLLTHKKVKNYEDMIRKELLMINCVICGKKIKKSNGNQLTCSDECRIENNKRTRRERKRLE